MSVASSQPSYSPPSLSVYPRPDPTPMGCELCGRPKAGFWRCVRDPGQPVARIARACPSCVGEDEPSEDTIGAGGLRESEPASQAAITPLGTQRLQPLGHINFLTPRGAPPLDWRSLLDGRAPISPLEPFKTLLLGVYSNVTDWILGCKAAAAGRRGER